MITSPKKILKNNVVDRFLPIPQTVLKGLEPEPKITDFTLIKELGVGSFGRVLLVQHNVTHAQYAIKAIDKRIKDNIEEKPYFRREMEIMYQIHHPNVVKLFGHFEDNTFCYFVMEYIPNGDLYSLVPKNGIRKINNQMVASLIKDVISALYYLHHMSPPIIHRDIKPENILVDEKMRAKLSDFGWSNYLKGNYKRTTICGTPIYLAPEIINNTGHDEKIDIWCVGVLMFELMTGQAPWKGEDVHTVKKNISQLKINWPKNMDKDARDLISKILRYMPEERPSLRTILMHPFFTKYYPNAVNCLQVPNPEGHRLYIISKDHPLTYNEGLSNDLFNQIIPNQNLPTSYTNVSSLNQFNFNSFPKTDYNQAKEIFYSVTPLTSNNVQKNYSNQTNYNNYIIQGFNNDLIQTDYGPTRNTFTVPLNSSIIPKNDYNQTRYTYTKLNNGYPQNEYNVIRTNGYSMVPSNIYKTAEIEENDERIKELVRRTVLGNLTNKNYKDINYQNMYNQISSNTNPVIYQTTYKTLKPTYYSDTNFNTFTNNTDNNYLYNTINNSSANNNNKIDFTVYNTRLSNLNNYFYDDYSFSVMNDPDIIKWKQQEKLRRESERLKLSSLMNRYGMSLTPIYSNNYTFL